jgi:predicted porin
MKNKIAKAVLLALGFSSVAANANLQFNGFASIKAGTTLDSDKSLFEYDDSLSFKPESLFALQTTADLGEGLSATTQIMARGENDYEVNFEWAYLTYQLNDNSQLKAGRLRIPFYRYSDFLDVGYAYNWMRPPTSVYSLPFSTYDGLSYIYNHLIGDWDSSIQLTYGSYEGDVSLISDADPSKLESITGINWTVGNDWLTARAVYMVADTTISFENDDSGVLIQGLGLISSVFPAHADRLAVESDNGSFMGLGISADRNNFLIDVEVTQVEVEDSLVAKQEQYYASVGYRMDSMVVYASIEHREDSHDFSMQSTLPDTVDLPIGPDGALVPAPIKSTFQQLLASQEQETDTMSVGLKYEFHPAASFKMDYTSRDTKGAEEVGVISFGVDLVF